MGLGEVAAMFMLNSEANRANKNAERLSVSYDALVDQFNLLREENIKLRQTENDLIKEYNECLDVIKDYDVDLKKAYEQRDVYKSEVVALKEKMTGIEAFQLKRDKWAAAGAKGHIEKQQLALKFQQQKIVSLTDAKSYLENELVKKENQVNQKGYVLEAIRRGMNEIPGEFRVKAAAKGYVRSPEISQATLDDQMPENMKADIEMYLGMALFPETGEKRGEILGHYEEAKEEIRKELAASTKVFEELIAIRAKMVQQAKDRGEDPSKIPTILGIQADMKRKAESEAIASTQKNDEGEEESYGPRLR